LKENKSHNLSAIVTKQTFNSALSVDTSVVEEMWEKLYLLVLEREEASNARASEEFFPGGTSGFFQIVF